MEKMTRDGCRYRRARFLAPILWGWVTLFAGGGAMAEAPLHLDGSAAAAPWVRYSDWTRATWDQYNTLRERARSPRPREKPIEITGEITGDPKKGQELAFSRARGGGCLACHVMGEASQDVPGNVGPDLSEIATAGRPDDYLYNYIYDPRHLRPDSPMPPWGAHGFYNDEEIRHIVAFLKTLKTPTKFRNPLDDPTARPLPVEDRDALDPFINPAVDRVDAARTLANRAGPSGKSCVSCHADLESKFAGWATSMPKWEKRLAKMIGVEEFVYRHAKATTGADYPMQSVGNTDFSVYLHFLSNGAEIRVDTKSPEAARVLALGTELYGAKVGQANFACVDCHTPDKGANKWIRGQYLGEAPGQMDHFPLWRTSRSQIWDIRKRLQWCNVQIRANELPPDAPEYDALELFLKAASQGFKLTAPNIRH
jgi:L-cysteine S-thiosulfotransferase